jgi:putative molybdopterin biosynthesis protein
MHSENLDTPGFQAVTETISSENFRRTLALQTGYDTTHTGEIFSI